MINKDEISRCFLLSMPGLLSFYYYHHVNVVVQPEVYGHYKEDLHSNELCKDVNDISNRMKNVAGKSEATTEQRLHILS